MRETAEQIFSRSNLYGLLAFGFGYPEADQYAQIVGGDFHQDVADCLKRCVPAEGIDFDALAKGLRDVGDGLGDLEAEYLNSFHTNMPRQSASLYESHYVPNADKAVILLELKAFYTNFGLTVNKDSGELEDNLTGELEFMHFLAAKEAQSMADGLNEEPYVLAQHDFLSRHLAVWIPAFQKDVAAKSMSGFYRTLAMITEILVGQDAERLSHVRMDTPHA